MKSNLFKALSNREKLIQSLKKEGTDSLRLFHGINEGYPGITIDKYGDNIIIQSFRDPMDIKNIDPIKKTINAFIDGDIFFIYQHRERNKAQILYIDESNPERKYRCTELGLVYEVLDISQGLDPLLFLDLRAGRRYLAKICTDKSVLNLFAYTCSAGIVAAANGAKSVANVDFSKTWLDYGRKNAAANNILSDSIQLFQEDFFPVMWQLSGLGMKGRVRQRKFTRLKKQKFDVIFMDPPTLAKSFFGAVDIINDYQSLFKPAILCLNEGGEIICTNHSAKVDFDSWIGILEKCAEKAGKPIKKIKKIAPEEDFPSPDGNHPLKILSIKF